MASPLQKITAVFFILPAIWICTSCQKVMPQLNAVIKDTVTVSLPSGSFTARVEGQTAQLTGDSTSSVKNFYAYVPTGYNAAPAKLWPVIIFLHGSYGSGTNINQVKEFGLARILDTARSFPFLVFSPQAYSTQAGSGMFVTKDLEKLLAEVKLKYNVDPKRVYLTGLSMGGIESWIWGIQDPASFAAVVPVSATGDPSKVSPLKNTPVWVFHGDQDPNVPYKGDVAMVNALKADGGNVQLYTVVGGGHDIWDFVYGYQALYTWMLQNKLP